MDQADSLASTWARRRFSTGGTFCPQGANTLCKPGGNCSVIVQWGDPLLPPAQQGVTILGTPLGHVEFVKVQVPRGHMTMLSGRCSKSLLDIRGEQDTFNLASLPCRLGGWVSETQREEFRPPSGPVGQILSMIRERNPDVADFITVSWRDCWELDSTLQSGEIWRARPDYDLWCSQHKQARVAAVENDFLVANVWPTLGRTEQALFRPQQGPMAGLPFNCMPITMESRFQPQELRVFFLRRLWQPTCRWPPT